MVDESHGVRRCVALRRTERLTIDEIVRAFHLSYYNSRDSTWMNTRWLGIPAQKCPLDLWIYQEILHEIRPDVIIESGTAQGGSALFLASVCDLLGRGRIITIDMELAPNLARHPRITYLKGSSIASEIVDHVRGRIGAGDRVMAIFDADHRKEHVLGELRAYGDFVSEGSYMIVEDTNINGNPVLPDFGPGPMEAVEEFLTERQDFVIDREREKFLMTFNPKGYLRKVSLGQRLKTTAQQLGATRAPRR